MEKEPVVERSVGEDSVSERPAPLARPAVPAPRPVAPARPTSAFVRAANEDDDGYDPYSDRPCDPEPRFEADPWR